MANKWPCSLDDIFYTTDYSLIQMKTSSLRVIGKIDMVFGEIIIILVISLQKTYFLIPTFLTLS